MSAAASLKEAAAHSDQIEALRRAAHQRVTQDEETVEDAVAAWRAAEAEMSLLSDSSAECDEASSRGDAMARRIMSMPSARIHDVIAKLEVLDSFLQLQHNSDEPFDDCRDIAMLGSIRADLNALAKAKVSVKEIAVRKPRGILHLAREIEQRWLRYNAADALDVRTKDDSREPTKQVALREIADLEHELSFLAPSDSTEALALLCLLCERITGLDTASADQPDHEQAERIAKAMLKWLADLSGKLPEHIGMRAYARVR